MSPLDARQMVRRQLMTVASRRNRRSGRTACASSTTPVTTSTFRCIGGS
jgi:hypothetical protein